MKPRWIRAFATLPGGEGQVSAVVDPFICTGCWNCVNVCPFGAPEKAEITMTIDGRKVTRPVSKINESKCEGCGLCVATCPGNCIDQRGFSDDQVYAELGGYLARSESDKTSG